MAGGLTMGTILLDILYAMTFMIFVWVGVKAVKAWCAGVPAGHVIPTLVCAAVFVALNLHGYLTGRPALPQLSEVLWSLWEVLVGFVLGRWIMHAQQCATVPGWCLACPRRYAYFVRHIPVQEP